MKLKDMKNRKELIGTALLAVSVLSVVLMAAKVAGFFLISVKAGGAVDRAIGRSKPDGKIVADQLDKSTKVADALKKHSLFLPPAKKRHPVNAVLGILGDEALINGRWYRAGDKVADASIVAVAPTAVTVEWDGKTKVFNPIDGGTSSGPSGPSRSEKVSSAKNGPGLVVTGSAAGAKPREADTSVIERSSKTYNNMSEAKKDIFKKVMAKNKEQYKNMSADERARFKAKIIERIGKGKEIRGSQPVKLISK
jgi:hypothetical protein